MPREITRTFCCDQIDGFDRGARRNVVYVCFTEYDVTIPNKSVAFKKISLTNTFGEYLAAHRMTQARIAEDGEIRTCYLLLQRRCRGSWNQGGDRILVKSPKVATYDLQPEMSVYEVCDKVTAAITSGKCEYM